MAHTHEWFCRAGLDRAHAYDWTAEVSVYLREGLQGQGIGSLLYGALIAALGRDGWAATGFQVDADMGLRVLFRCDGQQPAADPATDVRLGRASLHEQAIPPSGAVDAVAGEGLYLVALGWAPTGAGNSLQPCIELPDFSAVAPFLDFVQRVAAAAGIRDLVDLDDLVAGGVEDSHDDVDAALVRIRSSAQRTPAPVSEWVMGLASANAGCTACSMIARAVPSASEPIRNTTALPVRSTPQASANTLGLPSNTNPMTPR